MLGRLTRIRRMPDKSDLIFRLGPTLERLDVAHPSEQSYSRALAYCLPMTSLDSPRLPLDNLLAAIRAGPSLDEGIDRVRRSGGGQASA
jgi:hypothetical protein